MEIKDLFSHKIHSSGSDWPNKLIDIATIFSEFDGQPYDRDAIEDRLSKISPRSSAVARDPSKFRDEISAYPAYLGLYRVELLNDVWHIFLSQAAKQFLITEEPDVAAFMMLQLIVFQYPNGMGVAYQANSKNVRIQANTSKRTLEFVGNGIHLSPFRLMCLGLEADADIRNVSCLDAMISYDEVFILANENTTNTRTRPTLDNVKSILVKARKGLLHPPKKYESRFHILKHTNFLIAASSSIRLRAPRSTTDGDELIKKLRTINSIDCKFVGFDHATTGEDLLDEIRLGSWGRYFDGVRSLDGESVKILTNENPVIYTEIEESEESTDDTEIIKSSKTYGFRKIDFSENKNKSKKNRVYADPELTKIKQQRANLSHKILLEKLHDHMVSLGASPLENDHIDLYAELPSKEKYVFEVKSTTTDNLLSQTRRGVSQLYEYRYRYKLSLIHI